MTASVAALMFVLSVLQAPAPQSAQKLPVEKLGDHLFRVGDLRVDTAAREVTVPGTINQVTVVEFLANSKGGMKAYESALTLESDAVNFNVALVLIGLDRSHAKPATSHFDPNAVSGDPVALTVEWKGAAGTERGPVERLLFDKTTNAEVPPGDWVYTGSTFFADGRYAAEAEGVLIGFAHTGSSIIESVKGVGLSRYGTVVVNPRLGLPAGTPVALRITAIGPEGGRGRQ